MLKSKSFLCLDFGAFTLKAAEFEPNETGSLRLKNYALKAFGIDGTKEDTREETVLAAVRELVAEAGFQSHRINVCAPGFQVFSKFVKLPSVEASKVNQIIQYEAQQNVPFPLEEVVWDYQILGTTPNDELEILLVAIKNEVVESIFRVAEASGLEPNLVDVSSAALANAYRFNYGDSEGCVMLLDIGAKSSNLLFFEGGRVFSRSINIGANAITQDFATESKLDWEEAEKLKIAEGFVSLGGAYEEPDNPNQALISKIARQVMTRLHIQMNQTVQFYRGQQGGSPPEKLFLAGGASLLPYTAQFFAEKLNIPVDYFNPFRNIQIDEEINLEEIARVAHAFGEVVGLGIRNLAQCPVDLNLMPSSHIRRQEFNAKRIYFAGSALGLLLIVLSFGWYFGWVANKAEAATEEWAKLSAPLKSSNGRMRQVNGEFLTASSKAEDFQKLLTAKTKWANLLSEIQSVLTTVQTNHGITLDPNLQSSTNPILAAVWIESLNTGGTPPPTYGVQGLGRPPGMQQGMQQGMQPDGNDGEESESAIGMGGGFGAPPGGATGFGGSGAAAAPTGPKMVEAMNLTCRALNLIKYSAAANEQFVQALQNAFKTNAIFSPMGTTLTNQIEQVGITNITFGFNVSLQLAQPIQYN